MNNPENKSEKNIFLFSIDLEDIRLWIDDGLKYKERVPLMTEKYLEFLDSYNFKATFFVVGEVAKIYPVLIEKISSKGHEIACHSHKHLPLEKIDIPAFRADLQENIKWLNEAGVKNIFGYRAPIYSLTEKTSWAYKVLADMGFAYSSSVFPAKNPLYGWPEFGRKPKRLSGVWELPITLYNSWLASFPVAGAAYFRALPFCSTKRIMKNAWKKNQAIVGYFHPYDIDDEQERFMHPYINNNRLYNFLNYYHRKKVFPRLKSILQKNTKIIPYVDYVRQKLYKGNTENNID